MSLPIETAQILKASLSDISEVSCLETKTLLTSIMTPPPPLVALLLKYDEYPSTEYKLRVDDEFNQVSVMHTNVGR